jgi:hypothetical protein
LSKIIELKWDFIDDIFKLSRVVFFVLKDISSPSADRLVSSSSKLETKQKIQSVRYPADFLRKYLDSLILNLTKGKERYVELLDETLKKAIFKNKLATNFCF